MIIVFFNLKQRSLFVDATNALATNDRAVEEVYQKDISEK